MRRSRREFLSWTARLAAASAVFKAKIARAFPLANFGAFWQVFDVPAAGLWGTGQNTSGYLGNNSIISASSPVQTSSITTWTNIQTTNATIGLRNDGTLWSWGHYQGGTLGYGTNSAPRSSPNQIGTLTTWTKVSMRYTTAMAIQADGTLWAWGVNATGLMNRPWYFDISSPIQIGSATNWSNISVHSHALGVKTDGTLWTWGESSAGQLGLGTTGSVTAYSSPIQIGSLTTWSKAFGNFTTGFAIKADQTLWGMGRSDFGDLAQGDTAAQSAPVQIGSGGFSYISSAMPMFSDGCHTCALKADGTLWAWGLNTSGQMGTGDVISRSSPVQVGVLTTWTSLAAGNNYTLAVKADGTLWGWGSSSAGQQGRGNVISYSVPTQIGGLTTWSKVAAGSAVSLGLQTDGTLWTWGTGTYLGVGDGVTRSSPVQIGTDTTWSKIALSYASCFGIKTDGTLWGWGYNTSYFQLGVGDGNNRSSPTQVGTATTWAAVYPGAFHTLAIKTDGTLWAWGNNAGKLGTNSNPHASTPVQVGGLTTWAFASANASHSYGVRTDGTLWAWGDNSFGEMGQGTSTNSNVMQQVGTDTNWAEGMAGYALSLALKTDGTLWAWGANASGQLGKGDKVDRSSPVQIGTLTTWAQIVAAESTSIPGVAARMTDGTLWVWGNGTSGILGTGTSLAKSSPTQLGTLTTWSKLSAGSTHMAALKSDGTAWTWGDGQYGQQGNGTVASRSSPSVIGSATNWVEIWATGSETFIKAQ